MCIHVFMSSKCTCIFSVAINSRVSDLSLTTDRKYVQWNYIHHYIGTMISSLACHNIIYTDLRLCPIMKPNLCINYN